MFMSIDMYTCVSNKERESAVRISTVSNVPYKNKNKVPIEVH